MKNHIEPISHNCASCGELSRVSEAKAGSAEDTCLALDNFGATGYIRLSG